MHVFVLTPSGYLRLTTEERAQMFAAAGGTYDDYVFFFAELDTEGV